MEKDRLLSDIIKNRPEAARLATMALRVRVKKPVILLLRDLVRLLPPVVLRFLTVVLCTI